jgi:hypothetical protein
MEATVALDLDAQDTDRRRTARSTFGAHLTTYLFVNLLLFIVDAQSPGAWWFHWPLIGWGIGVASHAWQAFGGADASGRGRARGPEPHRRA